MPLAPSASGSLYSQNTATDTSAQWRPKTNGSSTGTFGRVGSGYSASESNPLIGQGAEPAGRHRASRNAERSSARARRDMIHDANKSLPRKITDGASALVRDPHGRLIAAAVILIVIAIVIAATMLISTAGNKSNDVISVQGGAVNTTSTDTEAAGATATITTTNGNPVAVRITVGEGQTSLVNVTYDDDSAYNGTAVGPWQREFQVTESMRATFGNPSAVQVTENGTEVPIETQEDGSGLVTLDIHTTTTQESSKK